MMMNRQEFESYNILINNLNTVYSTNDNLNELFQFNDLLNSKGDFFFFFFFFFFLILLFLIYIK